MGQRPGRRATARRGAGRAALPAALSVAAALLVAAAPAPGARPSATASASGSAIREAIDPGEPDAGELLQCLGGAEALREALVRPRPAAPSTLTEQIDRIATWVENERGLRFTKRPVPRFLTPDELRRVVAEQVGRDYPAAEARLDTELLSALGAIPAATDLQDVQRDLLSEQIAGYYDDQTGQLVVVTTNSTRPLGPIDQVTLAHELEHALADQALGLPDLDRFGDRDTDARTAALALVEGDATLTMQRYLLDQVPLADALAALTSPSARLSEESLERAPAFLRESLVFPYTAGLAYVCELKAAGGWDAVNRAYRDPPRSTLDVLDGVAKTAPATNPRDPGTLRSPWSRTRHIGVGAADLQFLFSAPGGDASSAISGAVEAARQWRGGEATQWRSADRTAVGISLDGSLCGAVTRWYRAAFPTAVALPRATGEAIAARGARHHAVLRCAPGNVRLGLGPDLATARALVR